MAIQEKLFFFQVPLVLNSPGLMHAKNGIWIQIEQR